MAIKAILFDLDGTLIEYANNYAHFCAEFASDFGIVEPSHPFFVAYSQAILKEGPVTFRAALIQALESVELSVPGDFDLKCQSAIAGYARGIRLLPKALPTLQYFENLPKAIVSNGPADMQRAAIEAVGIGPYFQTILVSGDADVAVRKPNPAIFHLACERLGVAHKDALMIGDNVTADIEGAEAAGLSAIHFQTM